VNSLPISLRVFIMMILVAQILKMCLTFPMVVVSPIFGLACPMSDDAISGLDANKDPEGFLPHSYFQDR
jgi:hypothetical protein